MKGRLQWQVFPPPETPRGKGTLYTDRYYRTQDRRTHKLYTLCTTTGTVTTSKGLMRLDLRRLQCRRLSGREHRTYTHAWTLAGSSSAAEAASRYTDSAELGTEGEGGCRCVERNRNRVGREGTRGQRALPNRRKAWNRKLRRFGRVWSRGNLQQWREGVEARRAPAAQGLHPCK